MPGFEIPNPHSCTVPELLDLVSVKGAQILIDGIRSGSFVPPVEPAICYPAGGQDGTAHLIHAGKIKTEDRHIDWKTWSWVEISKRMRVLGPLWSKATVADPKVHDLRQERRVIFTSMEKVELPLNDHFSYDPSWFPPGQPFVEGSHPFLEQRHQQQAGGNDNGGSRRKLYVFSQDGSLIRIHQMKVEGERIADGFSAALKARMVGNQTCRWGASNICTLFYERLA